MFMTDLSTFPEMSDATDRQGDDAAYYRRVLHDFIEMGAELARLVVQEARTAAEAAPTASDGGAAPRSGAGPERAVAFERIARAVRRSIMLARTLDEPVAAVDHTGERRRATRRRIIRAVEDMMRRESGDAAESLDADPRERLDADEVDVAIDPQIVAVILAEICQDLGLAAVPEMPSWGHRAPEAASEGCERAEWGRCRMGEVEGAAALTAPSSAIPLATQAEP